MPNTVSTYTSFNGGELSPEIQGRLDLAKYRTGLAECKNFIVTEEGGIRRRSGTRFIKECSDSNVKSRLIPFIFSTEQAYILEFTDRKIRVFSQESVVIHGDITFERGLTGALESLGHGYIESQGPVRLTTDGTLPTPLLTGTDYWISTPKAATFTDADIIGSTITFATPHNIPIGTSANYRFSTNSALPGNLSGNIDYLLSAVNANDVTVPVGVSLTPLRSSTASQFHTAAPSTDTLYNKFNLSLTEGGSPIVVTGTGTGTHTMSPQSPGIYAEIESPFAESELYDIRFIQSADILFLVHDNHPPIQIIRRKHDAWNIAAVNTADGPYTNENIDPTQTMSPSAATSSVDIEITLGAGTRMNDGTGWQPSDIGKIVRMKHGSGDWGYVEITGIHDTGTSAPNLVARASIRSALSGTTATDKWRIGSWYPGNRPTSISFAEQRLWMGGEKATPQTIHGSKTADFLNFAPSDIDGTVTDTSAINFEIGSNQVNSILWIASGKQLFVGTPAAVFAVKASLNNESITPTNINVPLVSTVGASSLQPIAVDDSVVFMTRNNQSMRALRPTGNLDIFDPEDISILSRHIFRRTQSVTTSAFQQDRRQLLWATLSGGGLICCTFNPTQQVQAWHNHPIGGNFQGSESVVESVAVIPSPGEVYDQLWMTVRRTINGSDVRYIELMEDDWVDGVKTSMRFVDSAPVAYSGAPTTSVSGLDHLEGQPVQVLADGKSHPPRTVSSGSITLDNSYSDVVVGLGYFSEMESLRLELPDRSGPTLGRSARIDHLYMRLFESHGFAFGPSDSSLEFTEVGGESAEPFTGDLKFVFSGGFQREKKFRIETAGPTSFSIIAISVVGSTGTK